MSENNQKERKLTGAAARIYDDQDDWLQKMRNERHAEPAEVARAAIDFYKPIFEANAQGIDPAIIVAIAAAVRMSSVEAVMSELEDLTLRLGGGTLAEFPPSVRREILKRKPADKRGRRVAGVR